jgi:hypothetical protein
VGLGARAKDQARDLPLLWPGPPWFPTSLKVRLLEAHEAVALSLPFPGLGPRTPCLGAHALTL